MNWLSRIVMGVLGLLMLLALLLGVTVYAVYATLRWLLTGRKPQVVLVWQQFQTLRGQFSVRGGFARSQADWPYAASSDQVVDVQAREVPDPKPQLPRHLS